jgi:hypothetical protein
MTRPRRTPIVRDREKATIKDVCARRKQTLSQFAAEAGCVNGDDLCAVAVALGCKRPTQDDVNECTFPQQSQLAVVSALEQVFVLPAPEELPAQAQIQIFVEPERSVKAESARKKKEEKKSQVQCNDPDGVV